MTTRHDKTPDLKGYKYLGTNPYECPQETDFCQDGRCLRTCWDVNTKVYWQEDSSD